MASAHRGRLYKVLSGAITSLSLVTASTAGAANAAIEINEARVRGEIMPLFTAMQAAANLHDVDAHLAYYTRDPSLLFVGNGIVIRGWENLRAQQMKWWPAGKIGPTDKAHEPYRLAQGPSFQLFGPNLAMLTFVLDARRIYPDKVMRRPLAISQLWQKQARGWQIVYAHESFGPEQPE